MPFPAFVAASALATEIADQTLTITAPSCQRDDILIAQVINKALTVAISPPDSSWTELYQADGDCTTAANDHRAALYWKRATQADSGAAFDFTKASGTVLFAGAISVWRGCNPFAPICRTALASQVNAAASDDITFAAFDPADAEVHAVFFGYYGNDLTTMSAAMSSDVNPDCTTRYDLESSAGNDCTLCCTSGNNDGSNIASRTWATASSADAGSTALVLGLVATPALPNNYQSVRADSGMSVAERVR